MSSSNYSMDDKAYRFFGRVIVVVFMTLAVIVLPTVLADKNPEKGTCLRQLGHETAYKVTESNSKFFEIKSLESGRLDRVSYLGRDEFVEVICE